MTMMVIRILLLLAPIVLLIIWLVKRSKHTKQEDGIDVDIIGARRILLSLLSLVIFIAAVLYFTENDRGDPGQIYVPARVEDGKVIPGYFKNEEDASPGEQSDGANERSDSGEGSDRS
jgi:hypothetical protein